MTAESSAVRTGTISDDLAHVLFLIDDAITSKGLPGTLSRVTEAEVAAGRFVNEHRDALSRLAEHIGT